MTNWPRKTRFKMNLTILLKIRLRTAFKIWKTRKGIDFFRMVESISNHEVLIYIMLIVKSRVRFQQNKDQIYR